MKVDSQGVADHEPGIFLEFHISPFMHVIEETRHSLQYLLIRVCAVIGGIMAVTVMCFFDIDLQVLGWTLLLFNEGIVDSLFITNTIHSTKQKTEAFLG